MCGIVGIFNFGEGAHPVSKEELVAIRDAMIRRGPDAAGIWLSPDSRIGLAHRRLSIIDLSESGDQPMWNSRRDVIIVFNGEIYNYRELRTSLASRGHCFLTQSDTEVILALYDEYGKDLVKHLRGMFAFAIWDLRAHTLLLARDHFGIKPFYFSDDGRTIRFASQVKALLRSNAIGTKPSPAGVVGFFIWGWVPEPYTTYEDIKSVPAGATIVVEQGKCPRIEEYFNVGSKIREVAECPKVLRQNPAEELRVAIADSVRAHLVADVPVGVFLSAGIDSSAIAGHAAASLGGRLRTLTLGFSEFRATPQDEVPFAEEFSRACGAQHITNWVTRGEFLNDQQSILDSMDQPSIDGVNTYFVSKAAAASGLKVALSGLGGDELFSGYPTFRQVPVLAHALRFSKSFSRAGIALRSISSPLLSLITSPKYSSALEYGGTVAGAYFLRRALYLPWELRAFLDEATIASGLEKLQTLQSLETAIVGVKGSKAQISVLETELYLRGQLLRDSDWAGMAHSVEIRVPFVDVELFERVITLRAQGHALTKRNIADTIPLNLSPRHRARLKTGFSTPVRQWIADKTNERRLPRGLRGWAHIVLPVAPPVRVLSFIPDAYGSNGGIALYNRDVLEALLLSANPFALTVFPRSMPNGNDVIPSKLDYKTKGISSKLRYIFEVLKHLASSKSTTLVFCGHINLLPIAWLASLWKTSPLILFIYGIEAWGSRSFLSRFLCSRADLIISISAITAQRFTEWSRVPSSKIKLLPNAIHLNRYDTGPAPDELIARYGLQGRKVLMTLGRLATQERYKGFDSVIDLMPDLIRESPDLAYLVAGTGGDRARLEQKVNDLGLGEHVIFTGFVSESEKAAHYRLADAFVMPSKGEGFGFVFLEALASGIPVVASSKDGGREAVRDGLMGHLADPDNREETKRAIFSALATKKGVVPEGLSYFSFENFSRRLDNILDDFLNNERTNNYIDPLLRHTATTNPEVVTEEAGK